MGASLVYTPTSKSMRGGGIGPVSNAQRAGVTVALGTGGPMVYYSVDMVEQMKVRRADAARAPPRPDPNFG